MLKTPLPFVDLRGKTLIDLVRAYPDKAHRLLKAARGSWGVASKAAALCFLPLADRQSRRWLTRTANPYRHEIESFADILETRGIFTLNLAYEWGCTSGVYRHDRSVSLLRVLDWPFPELGRQAMVVRQEALAGEFYQVTWPGMAGVYQGMAPGRFAAAINQAPMRKHGLGYAGDWAANRLRMNRENGIPPSHLLRQVFEQASDYEAARRMLMKTPISMPAIFVLSGVKAGQGCVIERLEKDAMMAELAAGQRVSAANHFMSELGAEGKGWRPREVDSAGRLAQGNAIHGHELLAEDFNWLHSPIINQYTRLAMVADAASGRLLVQGYEGASRVSELFNLPGQKPAEADYELQAVTGARVAEIEFM